MANHIQRTMGSTNKGEGGALSFGWHLRRTPALCPWGHRHQPFPYEWKSDERTLTLAVFTGEMNKCTVCGVSPQYSFIRPTFTTHLCVPSTIMLVEWGNKYLEWIIQLLFSRSSQSKKEGSDGNTEDVMEEEFIHLLWILKCNMSGFIEGKAASVPK